VISYNLYWLAVIIGFLFLGWKERKQSAAPVEEVHSDTSSGHKEITGKKSSGEGVVVGTAVKELQ
jgi:high-affinity iron transporter